MTKSEISKLLAKGELEAVLEILLHVTKKDGELNTEVSVISSSFHDLNKKERTNQLDFDKIRQAKAQTAAALVDFINRAWKNEEEDKFIPEKLIPTYAHKPTPQNSKLSDPNHSKPFRPKIWSIAIYLLVLGLTIAIGIKWWFLFIMSSSPLAPSPHTLSITVILYDDADIQERPLKKGTLKIEALVSRFQREALIDPHGIAIFDSIPTELIGKKVTFSLGLIEDFELTEPKKEYLLMKKVSVKIKKKKELKFTQFIPQSGEFFKGDWQNINSNSDATYRIEVSRAAQNASLKLRVRSKCCVLAHASPRTVNNDRLTLDDFDFSVNHYSNFVLRKWDDNLLVCTYSALLGDGRVFQVRDTLRRQ